MIKENADISAEFEDEEFFKKLAHSYEQALRGETRPIDEVFEELEKGLMSK